MYLWTITEAKVEYNETKLATLVQRLSTASSKTSMGFVEAVVLPDAVSGKSNCKCEKFEIDNASKCVREHLCSNINPACCSHRPLKDHHITRRGKVALIVGCVHIDKVLRNIDL